ncbi:uncharacterized protein LOC142015760 [Carettochelys insculpta]|uniref:uncharacterized protein LOC142015760 n=1 Tax=Carettochelys insculpta TaxID=44489 RepID=UPI003EBC4B1C
MGSKQWNADVFARLSEGLAAWGYRVRTPDHVRSKVKELRQGYAQAQDTASRSGAASAACPFYKELREILGPWYTTSPLATLDTSADEPQQAPEPESGPEASPAPQGPPEEPTPGTAEEEEGESSSDGGLLIDLPSRSSSRASARWVSPDCGSGPSAAPSEGPESKALHPSCRTAHRGHRSRPAQQRSKDRPQDEPDSAGDIPGHPLTPSSSPPSGIRCRSRSAACA